MGSKQKEKNSCGMDHYVRKHIKDPSIETCEPCPTSYEKSTQSDSLGTLRGGGSVYDNQPVEELSPEQKDDLQMCGTLMQTYKSLGSAIGYDYTQPNEWLRKQRAHDIKDSSNRRKGSKTKTKTKTETFPQCLGLEGTLGEGETYTKLMNLTFQKAKGCIEQHMHPSHDTNQGYSKMLFKALPKASFQASKGDSGDSGASIIDHTEARSLAGRHLANLCKRVEVFHHNRISEPTKDLIQTYEKPLFEVTLPSINLMSLSEGNPDPTSFAMKAINVALVAFIAYMFLKLILR
jgi:hypothetical protein